MRISVIAWINIPMWYFALFRTQCNHRLDLNGTKAGQKCESCIEGDRAESLSKSSSWRKDQRLHHSRIDQAKGKVRDWDRTDAANYRSENAFRKKLNENITARRPDCPASANLACPVPDANPGYCEYSERGKPILLERICDSSPSLLCETSAPSSI